MSWGVNFEGTKEEVLKVMGESKDLEHAPEAFRAALRVLVQGAAELPGGVPLHVYTYGHVDPGTGVGEGHFKIEPVLTKKAGE